MDDKSLRWKGRLGSLKGGCVIVILLAIAGLCVGGASLASALENEDTPQTVTVTQLANGEIEIGQYVSVSGYAYYDTGYEETEDSRTTALYYFLGNNTDDTLILIKHQSNIVTAVKDGDITITGMTRLMPSVLKPLLEEDMVTLRKNGLTTSQELIVADGQAPPSEGVGIGILALSLLALGISIVPFFFPSTLFVPQPVEANAAVPDARIPVHATGKFQKLKQLDPIEIGKGSQKFTNAVANIIPRGQGDLMIYIHHIVKTKTYGITVSTNESDWGAFFDINNVQAIEAGKLYGWQVKWVVRISYTDPKGKAETFFLTFAGPNHQAQFIVLLQKMGFQVNAPGAELVTAV